MTEPEHRSIVNGHFDYVLVGGGLQNALITLAIRAAQPTARIAMIERGSAPGGNHTWCFHAGDLSADAHASIEALVTARWDSYDVAFPGFARTVDSPYACVTAERLASVVADALAAPGCMLLTNTTATEVAADHVVVRDTSGATRTLHATAVIDARGPDRGDASACGWQKFVGLEIELATPHGLTRPMLMDATVPQRDGFRFMYVLPLSPRRVLVEDTYFSDGRDLEVPALRAEITAYVATRGWLVRETIREETGALPLPWKLARPELAQPLVAGYAGGWFHPVTGYSFPIAARLADVIAAHAPADLMSSALVELADEHARQQRFALRLNRMLFHWFPPDQRYHVLERFYRRLPEPSIRRFYALALTGMDRARIMLGRPPRGMSWRAAFGMEAS